MLVKKLEPPKLEDEAVSDEVLEKKAGFLGSELLTLVVSSLLSMRTTVDMVGRSTWSSWTHNNPK